MGKSLAIARLMLLDNLRDRSSLVSLILLPLLFTGLVGVVFSSAWGPNSPTGPEAVPQQISIALVDLDASNVSRRLPELLGDSIYLAGAESIPRANELINKGSVTAVVVIPNGFGDATTSFRPMAIELSIGERLGGELGVIQAALSSAVTRIRSMAAAADVAATNPYASAESVSVAAATAGASAAFTMDDLWAQGVLVTTNEIPVMPVQASPSDIPQRPIDQASIGFLVMFVMAGTTVAAGEMLSEKKLGTWGRLLSTPTGNWNILAGKLMGLLAVGWLQSAILIIGGKWLFGVDWGSSPLLIWIVLTGLILSSSGLGLLLSTIAKTHGQVVMFSNIVLLPTSMLAGVYWPYEIMPKVVQRIALLFPQRHAVAALINLIVRKSGPSPEVLRSCGVLLAFAIAFLGLGALAVKIE